MLQVVYQTRKQKIKMYRKLKKKKLAEMLVNANDALGKRSQGELQTGPQYQWAPLTTEASEYYIQIPSTTSPQINTVWTN